MSRRPPCRRPVPPSMSGRMPDGTCTLERAPGKQMCVWHWLMRQPADVQKQAAANRRDEQLGHDFAVYQARVSEMKWPPGERWCAGCQSFVPFFYCTGSRCKSCASTASHAQRIEREYGISEQDYDGLMRWQDGRCFICRRKPGAKKRLAVDHDHKTGEVRGLLCASNEHGCNRAVVGNLEGAADGGLAAAKRVVEYLERPPMVRLLAGEPGLELQAPQASRREAILGRDADLGPRTHPPPF